MANKLNKEETRELVKNALVKLHNEEKNFDLEATLKLVDSAPSLWVVGAELWASLGWGEADVWRFLASAMSND
jgi:hypothetical protein